MTDHNRNYTLIDRFQYLFGVSNPHGNNNNSDYVIIYQAFRYPNESPFLRYLALLTLAPDIIVMYLLGILAVRRDLHVIGVLVGLVPCLLLPNLFLCSASTAFLCYFSSYLCCFKCIKGHFWQKGLRSLRAQRTASIAFAFLVAISAIATNIVLGEITLLETLLSTIGGSIWGVVWWKIHRKYSPNIYTRLSRHWLLETLMLRNTCWISDLTAFECHNEMLYFRKFIEREYADTFYTEYNPEYSSPVHANIVD